jgi:tetratricopeptide (TPR) repeat protein/tRNA A-37 threonylcarbamoyl transferase component Bud32
MTFQTGELLLGKYKVIETIGSGGWGDVYLAEDTDLGRTVAIKHLRPELTKDQIALERFLREAKIIAGLRHRNIVTIFDLVHEGDDHYILMELAENGTLEDLIASEGVLQISRVLNLVTQVCQALEAVHSKGIIHRDIKPSNILLFEDLEGDLTPKLADFGIAQAPLLEQGSQLTAADSILGTVAYMAPEQARGKKVDTRSDIYAIGVLLYEMLTGKLPIDGNYLDLLLRKTDQVPAPPKEIRGDIPDDLNQLVLRALAKDPTKRFQTARAMVEALQSLVGGKLMAQELATIYNEGLKHLEKMEWQAAIEKFSQLPSAYSDAEKQLKFAREQVGFEELYQRGLQHFQNQEWREAVNSFGELIRQNPDYKDAEQMWTMAGEQEVLRISYERGKWYFDRERWDDAAATFQDIMVKAPDYRDAASRLAQAQQQIMLNNLYQKASLALPTDRFQEAIQALEQIIDLEPDYGDAAKLLEEAHLEMQVDSAYQEGVEYLMRENWHSALESFRNAQKLKPNYKNVSELLERAEQQAEFADLYEKGRGYESTEQWQKAKLVYLQLLKATDGEYRDVVKRLAEVDDQIRVDADFAKGQAAFEQEQWEDAISLLDMVLKQKPDHQKSIALLKEIRLQEKLKNLYDQVVQHETAEEWDKAVVVWKQIQEFNPDYENTGERLEKATRQHMLESLYSEGGKYLSERNYDKALECFDQVLDMDSNHKGAIASKQEAENLRLHSQDTEETESWWQRHETKVKTALIGLIGVIFSTLCGRLGSIVFSYWLNRPGTVPSTTISTGAATVTPASAFTVTTSTVITQSSSVTTTGVTPNIVDNPISLLNSVLATPLIAALVGGLVAAVGVLLFYQFLSPRIISIVSSIRSVSRSTLTGTELWARLLRSLAFVLAFIIAVFLLVRIMSALGKSIDFLSLLSHPAWQGVAALVTLIALFFQEDIRQTLRKPWLKPAAFLVFLLLLCGGSFIATSSSTLPPSLTPIVLVPTSTSTITFTSTSTPTRTPSPSVTLIITSTPTPSSTLTPTWTPTPTKTPTPTWIATSTNTPMITHPIPAADAVVIAPSGFVRLYSGPAVEGYSLVATLPNGTNLDILRHVHDKDDWIKVVANPGTTEAVEGYVSTASGLIRINVALADIPLIREYGPHLVDPEPYEQQAVDHFITFKWNNVGLQEGQCYSLLLYPTDEDKGPGNDCFHFQYLEAQNSEETHADVRPSEHGCTTGEYYWSVGIATPIQNEDDGNLGVCEASIGSDGNPLWRDDSERDERYIIGIGVPPRNRPSTSDGGDNGIRNDPDHPPN